LIKGAVAGAVATCVMNQVTTWLYERESEAVRTRENDARGGQTAYVTAAERLADAAGYQLSDEGKGRAGTAIHYATGVAAGMKYAAFRRYWPRVTQGFGVPFGIAFFLLMDELVNPVLGLTPGPAAFPWQAHARGLGGHLAFGAANDTALRALDRVA
jgi:uncharacterized membrane protein YagU involved in acid resistance